jgi:hypothetical protein
MRIDSSWSAASIMIREAIAAARAFAGEVGKGSASRRA